MLVALAGELAPLAKKLQRPSSTEATVTIARIGLRLCARAIPSNATRTSCARASSHMASTARVGDYSRVPQASRWLQLGQRSIPP